MKEILPGVFHWEAMHPKIGVMVSSYWLAGEGVLIDPLLSDDLTLEHFASVRDPVAIVLSNRHHYRDSGPISERYGCPVYCNSEGLHEFSSEQPVVGFQAGDELPGGIHTREVGGICPDDSALYLPAHRAIVFADGVVLGDPHGSPLLGFVPDSLMDDPQGTKDALLSSISRLLEELAFEHLLLAHGGPVLNEGRIQLEELLESGGRTAFEF